MVEDRVEPESNESWDEVAEPLEQRRRHIVPLVHAAVAWVSALFQPVVEYSGIPVPQQELGVYLCEQTNLGGKCVFVRGKVHDLGPYFASGPRSVVCVGAGMLWKQTLGSPPHIPFQANQKTRVDILPWPPKAAEKR